MKVQVFDRRRAGKIILCAKTIGGVSNFDFLMKGRSGLRHYRARRSTYDAHPACTSPRCGHSARRRHRFSGPPRQRRDVAGECPLKHTDVKAEISGFSRARHGHPGIRESVPRTRSRPSTLFRSPPDSAVDDMTMLVGDRTIAGTIKPRDEARDIYEDARDKRTRRRPARSGAAQHLHAGGGQHHAGAKVKITISYVETVPYEDGAYEFRFPMVVAPRYIPGKPDRQAGRRLGSRYRPGAGRLAHHAQRDARRHARRTRHLRRGQRSMPGVPIEDLESPTHDVTSSSPARSRAVVRLNDKATIPNKDFILQVRRRRPARSTTPC